MSRYILDTDCFSLWQQNHLAAIVLANNAIIVTRNYQDFLQVPDLVQEDWTIQS
ncbi:MAG: hypothetical protein ACRC62_17370 [Microcoleus sp.]